MLEISDDHAGQHLWLSTAARERAEKERERAEKEREIARRLELERRVSELERLAAKP